MNIIKRMSALIVAVCLLLTLPACGGGKSAGDYRVVETLAEEQFRIAYRQGDRLGDTVNAALAVLVADGTVGEISRRWFGKDVTLLEGDAQALEKLEHPVEPRSMIIGLDAYNTPMSFRDLSGNYVGFDVELAQAVCSLLGWELRYQPIEQEKAAVELAAGNIDAAWGGMSFAADERMAFSPVYMDNNRVLVSLADDGIKRLKALEGKELGMRKNQTDSDLLDSQEGLRDKLKSVNFFSGTERLFTALDGGQCDAIITDQVALDYYAYTGR